MKKLPSAVADALEKARKELGSNVSISRLNGHYYVYRRSTRWDKEKKKVRSIAEYLGKITDDGTFIRKGMVEGDLEHARELIIARGGSVTLPEATAAGRAALSVSEPLNATDRKILTALSMNSRASLGLIGRLSGLKPSSVHYRIKQLEERFGIRYIAEPSIIKLGYLEYIALLRFVGKRPDVNALKDAFSKVHNVQLVLLTSGRYDMVIRFVARSNENSSSLFYSLMKDDTIGEYDMGWTISPFFSSYGFVPLREEFYDLLKERIWKRSKDTPRMLPGQITEREHAVLRELNSGANKDFTDIDKRLGLERGTARYTYYRLVEQGILVRPTIPMTHPGARYNSVIIMSAINGRQMRESRERLLFEIIADAENASDRYSIVGDMGAPSGALFIAPIFRDGDLQRIESNLLEKIKGADMMTLVVTEVLVGRLCYRLFDKMHSGQYNRILKEYRKDMPQNKIDYDDTGRKKKGRKKTEEFEEPEENETD